MMSIILVDTNYSYSHNCLLLIIKFQRPIKDFLSFNFEKSRTYIDNFFYEASPGRKRHRPLSLIERETELKLYIGDPFRGFSRDDWNEFWQIIYGGYPLEDPGTPGLPKKMRQLTEEEIASRLVEEYREPFSYFKETHWKFFFDIAIKK